MLAEIQAAADRMEAVRLAAPAAAAPAAVAPAAAPAAAAPASASGRSRGSAAGQPDLGPAVRQRPLGPTRPHGGMAPLSAPQRNLATAPFGRPPACMRSPACLRRAACSSRRPGGRSNAGEVESEPAGRTRKRTRTRTRSSGSAAPSAAPSAAGGGGGGRGRRCGGASLAGAGSGGGGGGGEGALTLTLTLTLILTPADPPWPGHRPGPNRNRSDLAWPGLAWPGPGPGPRPGPGLAGVRRAWRRASPRAGGELVPTSARVQPRDAGAPHRARAPRAALAARAAPALHSRRTPRRTPSAPPLPHRTLLRSGCPRRRRCRWMPSGAVAYISPVDATTMLAVRQPRRQAGARRAAASGDRARGGDRRLRAAARAAAAELPPPPRRARQRAAGPLNDGPVVALRPRRAVASHGPVSWRPHGSRRSCAPIALAHRAPHGLACAAARVAPSCVLSSGHRKGSCRAIEH